MLSLFTILPPPRSYPPPSSIFHLSSSFSSFLYSIFHLLASPFESSLPSFSIVPQNSLLSCFLSLRFTINPSILLTLFPSLIPSLFPFHLDPYSCERTHLKKYNNSTLKVEQFPRGLNDRLFSSSCLYF